VELKRRSLIGKALRARTFESNQSGIETSSAEVRQRSPGDSLNRTKVELKPLRSRVAQLEGSPFESNQSGIETRSPHFGSLPASLFESNQSGIETTNNGINPYYHEIV